MGKTKITVICVTNRKGALKILQDDLSRQTFRDFNVVVADELYGKRDVEDNLKRWKKHFVPRPKNPGDVWNLNKAYNDCLDAADGELLVFLQDFIWIPANGLEKFWDMYLLSPNQLTSGVGHKARVGLKGISEIDSRVFYPEQGSWELNWAACPRAIMPRFNEAMDEFYGGENLYIQRAAKKAGHYVFVDNQNVCIGYSQGECGGRPSDWETSHCNKNGRLAKFLDMV